MDVLRDARSAGAENDITNIGLDTCAMKKSFIFAIFGLVLAATSSAEVTMDDVSVRQTVQVADFLNELCRNGAGNDKKTRAACEQRDKLTAVIASAGWCHGKPGDARSQRQWEKCQQSASAPSAAPSQEQRAFNMTAAINGAIKSGSLSSGVRTIDGTDDGNSYSLILRTTSAADAKNDTYVLAQYFVRYLVSAGMDPSKEKTRKFVHVQARQEGVPTTSGKPEVRLLDRADYNPFTNAITQDK